MEALLALVVGALFGAAFYLLMRRSLFLLVVGVAFLTNAANLLLFVAGGLGRGAVPVVPRPLEVPNEPIGNPLVQALILTAIVIGLGVQAFTLALVRSVADATDSGDVASIRGADAEE